MHTTAVVASSLSSINPNNTLSFRASSPSDVNCAPSSAAAAAAALVAKRRRSAFIIPMQQPRYLMCLIVTGPSSVHPSTQSHAAGLMSAVRCLHPDIISAPAFYQQFIHAPMHLISHTTIIHAT